MYKMSGKCICILCAILILVIETHLKATIAYSVSQFSVPYIDKHGT